MYCTTMKMSNIVWFENISLKIYIALCCRDCCCDVIWADTLMVPWFLNQASEATNNTQQHPLQPPSAQEQGVIGKLTQVSGSEVVSGSGGFSI